MAHWKDAVVTDEGVELLNEWLAGRKITIVGAEAGTGTVDVESLTAQTGLVNKKQDLNILGQEDGPEGKVVQVQVNNAEVMEEYELNQVGVYAALDVDREPEAPRHLLFIMQDERGVTVPDATDASFLLELYCAIGITNNGRFEVSVSAAGIVTMPYLREQLERAFAQHNADDKAHNSMAARIRAIEEALNGWDTILDSGDPTKETVGHVGQHYINTETEAEYVCTEAADGSYTWEEWERQSPVWDLLDKSDSMETQLEDVDARLALLELMYRTQVSGNPFTVSFDNMNDLKVTGVWNDKLKRVEF